MNTKKKILFLVTQSEFGGAQRFIYRLITNLDLSKYDISIAAGPEGNNANGLLFNLKKEGFGIFPLKFLKRSINPVIDFRGILEIHKLIKKQNPDIVFLCSTKAGVLGSIAARFSGKKVIYRIGGWTFNDPWPKWKKNLFLWLEKKTAKFKDIIVNNSRIETEQAKKLGIKPRKEIITIYNGLDTEKLDFLTRKEARDFLKINPEFLVGTVANFYPVKNLKILVEAANLLKSTNIKFVIIGEGKDRKEIEELINRYDLRNFFLAGEIPDAWKYLKAFDVFVLPSLKEGFPWTVIEAMAAEIPVVATRVGAIPEILVSSENSEENGILVEPGEVYQIVEAIDLLSKNKELMDLLISRAGKIVKEKFNLKKMTKEYEDLFSVD